MPNLISQAGHGGAFEHVQKANVEDCEIDDDFPFLLGKPPPGSNSTFPAGDYNQSQLDERKRLVRTAIGKQPPFIDS
jgi:hypothetical protein